MSALDPALKGAPKWKVLKAQVPDYTCTTVDVIEDWCRDNDAPADVLEALRQVRCANVNFREVCKQAIREIRLNK